VELVLDVLVDDVDVEVDEVVVGATVTASARLARLGVLPEQADSTSDATATATAAASPPRPLVVIAASLPRQVWGIFSGPWLR
jgi:hypothetical protein